MRYALAVALALISSASARSAERSAQPVAVLRLEDLSQTRDRPLFSQTRRPPAAVELSAPSEAATADANAATRIPFELVGSVRGERVSYVLLRNRATHEVKRFDAESEAAGWKIGAVGFRSVELTRGGDVETLTLGNSDVHEAGATPQLASGATTAGAVSPSNESASRGATSAVQSEYDRLMRKLHLPASQ